MGSSINKVILLGNLGADPELRNTNSGTSVCNFRIATSEWDGKDKPERTEWHSIVVWDKLADLCGQYLSKGRKVCIEGKLQTRKWEDREGNKRYTTEVVAREVVFLGGKDQQQRKDSGPPPGGGRSAPPVRSNPQDDESDIPFRARVTPPGMFGELRRA